MVLDAKALTWAAKNDIDTAKLKKARVPIYGKWYFPEIPAGVPLVNLETGEQQVFPDRMVAGEVIFVPAADLSRVGLAPEGFSVMPIPASGVVEAAPGPLVTLAPEPLLAMARPPGLAFGTGMVLVPVDEQHTLVSQDTSDLVGIHMPSPSIAPFVLGVGFAIFLLGVISNVIILVVGLVWMLAGCVAWIRVGLLEARAAAAHAAEADH
ncbi:MAG TPA: hypothetical protein VKV73_11405 [Chloroflexota bacterium]|nr:hypothetical protein [Chloroflexota bacterium]